MSVYEVTTRSHLKKVDGFFDSQPKEWYLTCMTQGRKGGAVRFLEFLKNQGRNVECYVCEDETGKVRVFAIGEPDVKVNIYCNHIVYMDYADVQNWDFKYLKKYVQGAMPQIYKRHGITKYESLILPMFVDMLRDLLPKAKLTVVREEYNEYFPGKVFICSYDFSEFLGVNE